MVHSDFLLRDVESTVLWGSAAKGSQLSLLENCPQPVFLNFSVYQNLLKSSLIFIKMKIAWPHTQSFWLYRPGLRPKKLSFLTNCQVMLILLVWGQCTENNCYGLIGFTSVRDSWEVIPTRINDLTDTGYKIPPATLSQVRTVLWCHSFSRDPHEIRLWSDNPPPLPQPSAACHTSLQVFP